MNDQPTAAPTRRRNRQKPENSPEAQAPQPGAEAAAQAPAAQAERPSVRTPMRAEAPRQSAEERAREILEGGGLGSVEGVDEFYINPKDVPDGWTYEWKRQTVYNMADPAYDVQLARTGWTAVPAKRHPDMMPVGWSGNTITRKGQILMERPKVITEMVENNNKKRARDQVRIKEQQLSSAPKDQLPRAGDDGGDPRTKPVINKGYEPMPIPEK